MAARRGFEAKPLHESLLQLIANCGQLVAAFLRGHALIPEGPIHAESVSADLSQIAPAEFRADQVITVRDPSKGPMANPELVVVVEIQLHIDRDKQHTWPVYVAAAAAKHRCCALLLVIAPDPKVAIWAHGPFGQLPGLMLEPIVLSYADVPEHLDEEVAQRFPELAVLAAIAHPSNDEIAQQALRAIAELDSERNSLYFDILKRELPHLRRSSSEASMLMVNGVKYYSDFAIKFLSLGMIEGARMKREESSEFTMHHGIAFALARGKLGELPASAAEMIRGVRGEEALTCLILAIGTAPTSEGVLEAIAHAARQ